MIFINSAKTILKLLKLPALIKSFLSLAFYVKNAIIVALILVTTTGAQL